jgi:tRNA threonylcarbamoyladenosine biosynthesis protein TsaB
MLVAALDTSTNTLSCALVEIAPGRLAIADAAAERPAANAGGHAPRLPGVLAEMLARAGRAVADLDAFAIGLGPGSFTGLRIGLATWKGLAYARRRPVAGASGLRAMALEAAPLAPEGALLVPVLDARKSEVYAGFYRARGDDLEAVAPDAVLSPAALAARLARPGPGQEGGPRVGFGEGWDAYRPVLEEALPSLPGAPATPSAAAVARCAAPRLLAAPFDLQALFALEPCYLRPSEAEVKFPDGLPPTRR